MRLPTYCELDPDGDVTSSLANHLKNNVSRSSAEHGRGTKRSLSGRYKTRTRPAASQRGTRTPASRVNEKKSAKIWLKVSSKHLTLASPVFKALLRGSFAESSDLQSDLSPEILLHDDDPAAFWLLLYIIHGRPKQVPNKIGLETLTQIALLVDKYELHEVSEVITDGWIEQIQEEDVPDCEHDIGKVAQLLCVAWVFRNPMMFSKMTFLAMQLSVGNFACVEAAHLPITAAVLDKIEDGRANAMRTFIEVLRQRSRKYLVGPFPCCGHHDQECDALVIGDLMKGLAAGNLYPLPNYPYGGYSYSNLSKLMMGMEFPSLCAVLGRTVLMGAFGASPCGFKTFVHEGIQKTSQTLSGLELNDILNPPNLEENVESSSKV